MRPRKRVSVEWALTSLVFLGRAFQWAQTSLFLILQKNIISLIRLALLVTKRKRDLFFHFRIYVVRDLQELRVNQVCLQSGFSAFLLWFLFEFLRGFCCFRHLSVYFYFEQLLEEKILQLLTHLVRKQTTMRWFLTLILWKNERGYSESKTELMQTDLTLKDFYRTEEEVHDVVGSYLRELCLSSWLDKLEAWEERV